jgi:tetratricopeptide (TPR) repeat protein
MSRAGVVAAAALACACSRDGASERAASPVGDASPAPARRPIPEPDVSNVADAPLREALAAARRNVIEHEEQLAAWAAYGGLLASHDWRREAAAAFARAEELEPANFRWPYLQGFELAACDVAAALAAYERAMKIDPDYAPGQVNWGRLLLENGRIAEAVARFERAVALDAANVEGWLKLGQAQLQLRDVAAADSALRRAVALAPDHPEVRSALASVCHASGRKAEAQEHARLAKEKAGSVPVADPRLELDVDPVTADDHVNAALARLKTDQLDQAEPLLRRALAIQPRSAPAWGGLATVYMKRNDFGNAEKAARESIRVSPTVDAELTLAGALYFSGRKKESADSMLAAARLAPADVEVHVKAATILSEVGRLPDAIEMLETVVAVRPDDEAARLQLVVTLRSLAVEQIHGRLCAEGIATMRRALAAKPDHYPVERDLALLLATLAVKGARDGEEAVRLAEHALQGREHRPLILDALAAAYAETGRFDDAVRCIERGLERLRADHKPADVKTFEARLRLYQEKKPLRIAPEAVR